jgi:hypothetical protein
MEQSKVKVVRRPKGSGKHPLVALRIPVGTTKQLDAWARRVRISRSELVRRLIDSGLQLTGR